MGYSLSIHLFLYFISSTSLLNEWRSLAEEAVIVKTKYGRVGGHHSSIDGFEWDEFLGVPFAAPPVGDLRFQPPKTSQTWTNVLRVTEYQHSCYEMSPSFPLTPRPEISRKLMTPSEDCLYLNVFVPHSVKDAHRKKRAVMVWIHGGSFVDGNSGYIFDGMVFSPYADVILVTLAYRLNVFGFLTTRDEAAPGNIGLLDQQAGLRWVHENIAYFGGDVDRITLYGESAGAASVGLHLLSSESRDMFQQAAMFSGSAAAVWATQSPLETRTVNATYQLAQHFACEMNNSMQIISCLQKVQAKDLVEYAIDVVERTRYLPFRPIANGPMVAEYPKAEIAAGVGAEKKLFISSNNKEWLFSVQPTLLGMLKGDNTVDLEKLTDYLKTDVIGATYAKYPQAALAAILNEYNLTDHLDLFETIEKVTTIRSLGGFIALSNWDSYHYSRHGAQVHQMLLTHTSSTPLLWDRKTDLLPGANHADDLMYTFGAAINPHFNSSYIRFTAEEEKLSYCYMDLLSSFAETGTPKTDGVEWPMFQPDGKQYLVMHAEPSVSRDYMPKDTYFWNIELPKIAGLQPAN